MERANGRYTSPFRISIEKEYYQFKHKMKKCCNKREKIWFKNTLGRWRHFVLGLSVMVLSSCSSDDGSVYAPVQISTPTGNFQTARMRVLPIIPKAIDGKDYIYRWYLGDSLLAIGDTLDFIAIAEGNYCIRMEARDKEEQSYNKSFHIKVTGSNPDCSPYISKIIDYRPAPGQFVNTMPEYEEGDGQEDMNRKALSAIGNNVRGLVSLGGFGGYVICGFDHTIVNVPGAYDFKVLGNTFYVEGMDADSDRSGACEPGIVMVAYDKNRNGKPDEDEWYELAGSEYHTPLCQKNYKITYYPPNDDLNQDQITEGSDEWCVNPYYILWEDNASASGYMPQNMYHAQSYFPQWLKDKELTFTGTLLPPNGTDEDGDGYYWITKAYAWGYADNGLNSEDMSSFKIEWAVDKNGNKVHLPGVDFIKIYTGVHQQCGWTGEVSTEVMGITDLHATKK